MSRIRIMRASTDFSLVIVVVSTKVDVYKDPEARFYRFKGKFIDKITEKDFKKIDKKTAEGYQSGQADGIGHGIPPAQGFNSFESCGKWIRKAESRFYRKIAREGNWESPKKFNKRLDRAFAEWFGYKPQDGPKPSSKKFDEFAEHFFETNTLSKK